MTANAGTRWSKLAIRDLRWSVRHGWSVEDIAVFLCRSEAAVRAKMAELGFRAKRRQQEKPAPARGRSG